jgi:hypothetical protein
MSTATDSTAVPRQPDRGPPELLGQTGATYDIDGGQRLVF